MLPHAVERRVKNLGFSRPDRHAISAFEPGNLALFGIGLSECAWRVGPALSVNARAATYLPVSAHLASQIR